MNFEEVEQNPISHHFLDCFDDSISHLPFPFDSLDDSTDVINDSWWVQSEDIHHEPINNTCNFYNNPITSDSLSPSSSSTKRKTPDDSASKNRQENVQNNHRDSAAGNGAPRRKPAQTKKATAKPRGNNNCNNGNNNRETWAGQLLKPCAAAISTGNLTRAQHLLCVLKELASLTSDANRRLAAHGLTALTRHLSSSPLSNEAINFASTIPTFFRQSLIDFNDINPWFTIPNNFANSSILQILSNQDPSRNLHILDIGVSHGVQWPILLEALTHQPNGPPPLIRLTVIGNNQTTYAPFVTGPPGYDFTSKLLSFANNLKINLQITRLENHPLQNLNARVINSSPDDTLIVCAQFRLHHLRHDPDERTEFLRVLRSLEPKGVILSENNMMNCACNNCGDFATAFSRRLDYLWIFLDSTGAAFKGRESEERRMMEGEAAKALTNASEMNERKEKWCERMTSVGFVGDVFGEHVMDGARALLKKYDNKWEMSVGESDGCVNLQWKGQPVSFCSLWKIDTKQNYS